MTRTKRPVISLVITIVSWMALGLMIWKLPPRSSWIELAATLLLIIGLVLSGSWIMGSAKRGVQFTLAIVGLLLMRRFGILDALTIGLWLVVIGLISLIS